MVLNEHFHLMEASSRLETNRVERERTLAVCAMSLYRRAQALGLLGRTLALLSGRSSRLKNMADLAGTYIAHDPERAGLRAVAINAIIGSEGRSDDFDRNFYPLQQHTRDRWIAIAIAMMQHVALPPVTLARIGDHYYVRDGHHRISVARMLGQLEVDAEVLVYAVADQPDLSPAPVPAA